MFALSCDGGSVSDLHSVDAASAVITQVGTGIPRAHFSSDQPAWDAVTRTAYFLNWAAHLFHLSTMNILTGVSAVGAQFTISGVPAADGDAIAISPTGAAFAIDGDTLYSIDAVTGASNLVVTLAQPDPQDPSQACTNPYRIQFDSSGILWIQNNSNVSGTNGYLWSVDITTPASASETAVNRGPFTLGVTHPSFVIGQRHYLTRLHTLTRSRRFMCMFR